MELVARVAGRAVRGEGVAIGPVGGEVKRVTVGEEYDFGGIKASRGVDDKALGAHYAISVFGHDHCST